MAEPQPNGADQSPHDVLAAEMFAVPAPDPGLRDPGRQPHDVLAAEMFAVPAPDPTLHHAPVVLPTDLTGEAEPRDVLAAEEFAMPAPPAHPDFDGPFGAGARSRRRAAWAVAALVAVGVVVALRGRRRGRR